MFPHSYTYNPGVVLDPITMTPMITHGGNITVNPLGVPMRPEQKVWQKMFIKNIPQECSNDTMQKLLNEFGAIKNFKRTADNRGKLLPFCHFQLETGEEIMRIKRLFLNIHILDKDLNVKFYKRVDHDAERLMEKKVIMYMHFKLAPAMNEAKQYQSIEVFHIRDDKKYKQKIQDTLRIINSEVKKVAAERLRQEERKEHPREKEREKMKKKTLEQLDRNFHQKQEQWLKRQREKQRDLKKQKERQREREKTKFRRLQKQINQNQDELQKKAEKFLNQERRKFIQREEQQDQEIIMEENPPLPEEQAALEEKKMQQAAHAKRVKAVMEEIQLGNQRIQEQVIVKAPQVIEEEAVKPKELQKHELFEGYEKLYEQKEKQPQLIELNIPQIPHQEVDKQQEERRNQIIKQLTKKIPQNKQQLWQFSINWEKLSKSVVLERYIRPWLEEMSNEYMGGVEQKFIALVQKKLLSRSHPDKIIKILKLLLDDDSEQFVIRLWKKLVLEYLKLENGLV